MKSHKLSLTYEEYQKMGKNISFYKIDKYVILDSIGKGGFGTVYQGINDQDKLTVAAKTIDIQAILQQPSQKKRAILLRLAESQDILMRVCDSPNLVKCYDVYCNNSLKIIIMEYCNGGTLRNYIQQRGRIPQKQALLIIKQILNGVSELHSHKIIHRDLKSQNILSHNGLFKIADFGFSKKLQIEHQDITVPGTLLGTLTNMAPQVMKRQLYGLKADIWSVGVILFQMVFGKFPFTSREKNELLKEITSSQLMKGNRMNCNGYTATPQMTKFIKSMMKIDQSYRIGWKQIIADPLLSLKDQKIPRSQIPDVPLIPPSQVNENEINNFEENMSSFIKKLRIFTESSTCLQPISGSIIKNLKNKKTMSESQKMFMQMDEWLYQCLIAELIYEEIISKIEKYELLDLEQRPVKQFLYILTTRCFLNLSPINVQLKKYRNQYLFVEQTYDVVKILYNKLNERFNHYGKVLKEQQDKLLNRFKDFITSKEDIQYINKFLNGIPGHDYTLDEQLTFIEKHYIDNFELKGPAEIRMQVNSYLKNYVKINKIDLKIFKNKNFDSHIKKIVDN